MIIPSTSIVLALGAVLSGIASAYPIEFYERDFDNESILVARGHPGSPNLPIEIAKKAFQAAQDYRQIKVSTDARNSNTPISMKASMKAKPPSTGLKKLKPMSPSLFHPRDLDEEYELVARGHPGAPNLPIEIAKKAYEAAKAHMDHQKPLPTPIAMRVAPFPKPRPVTQYPPLHKIKVEPLKGPPRS